MVNQCANPECGKPLHYLREGRVYVFDVTRFAASVADRTRRMEHFWLCGSCSELFLLEQTPADGVRISRRQVHDNRNMPAYEAPQSIAS